MRQGHSFNVDHSSVVLRRVLGTGIRALAVHGRSRYHRWLIVFAFTIGIAGSQGLASAAPLIVPMADHGGGATMPSDLRSEYAAVRLFDSNGNAVAPEICPPCRVP